MNQRSPFSSSAVAPPAPFLRSLRQILDNESASVISWTPDGAAFEIYDVLSMAKHVLPKHFKHANYSSFQRQLNYFRFRKWTRLQTDVCTFSNPFFRKDAPKLMCHIVRKKSPSRQAASTSNHTSTSSGYPPLEPIAYTAKAKVTATSAIVPASPSDVTGFYPRSVADPCYYYPHSIASGPLPASVGDWIPQTEPLAAEDPLTMAGESADAALEWLDALYPSLDAVRKLDDTHNDWYV